MLSFHAKDTRHALESFRLTRKFFSEQKSLKPNKKCFPPKILSTLELSLLDQEFPDEHEFLNAVRQVLKKDFNAMNSKKRDFLLKKARQFKRADIENFALQFTRFWQAEPKENKQNKHTFIFPGPGDEKLVFPDKAKALLQQLRQREKERMRMYAQSYPLLEISGKLDWRMIVGLGNEHIKETNMTLHHVYGIPYIPGSAIKGMVRHYFISEVLEPECRSAVTHLSSQNYERLKERFPEHVSLLEELCIETNGKRRVNLAGLSQSEKDSLGAAVFAALEQYIPREHLEKLDTLLSTPDLKDLLKDSDAERQLKEKFELEDATIQKLLAGWDLLYEGQRIFGTQEQRGAIVFFDAYPISDVKFEVDIMNPHYPGYYTEKQRTSPHDSQEPRPVTFLTIAKTTFTFYIGQDIPGAPLETEKNPTLLKALDWLQKALETQGIGAKSSVGYGYFKRTPTAPEVQRDTPKTAKTSYAQKNKKESASDELLQQLAARFNK